MTDITVQMPASRPRRVDLTSKAAMDRLKSRYGAEARFRFYGIAALTLTTVFLVLLLADILMRGIPAFWQHVLVVDLPLKAELIDPKGNRNPSDIRGGDYTGLARGALSEAIPGIEDRAAKKQLNDLLSTGAADRIRNDVMANPDLIGTTIKANLLLSDTADLYFKGEGTRISRITDTRGTAAPSAATGQVKIAVSGDDLKATLAAVKQDLAKLGAELEREAQRMNSSPAAAPRIERLRSQAQALKERYSNASAGETLDSKLPSVLLAINGGMVKITSLSQAEAEGEVLIPLASTNEAKAGEWQIVTYETPEGNRNVSDRMVSFLEKLKADGKIESQFNTAFFTSADSREPELAGILGALTGSAFALIVTLALCLPIGVMAAIYLEEFAPKNWMTDIIEININNLAAVPSIVFGLLGLAVFLNFFGLPRSAPLVGGLVLALLVLPTIIIAARAALKAVPPSIKEAALGVGASKQQAIFHHVLPLAMPGILTGTIIGMAHALGETAPLLMIGMIAFVSDIPQGFTDAATALPVQIFLWSDLPEPAFKAKTAAAIIVLLVFLFVMNGTAIWLRKRFERRW
jgi:phosphate transport system permease protein